MKDLTNKNYILRGKNMGKTIELDNGKYAVIYDENNQYPMKCLRYGEEWRNLVGDNLIFWLCAKIEELEEKTNT